MSKHFNEAVEGDDGGLVICRGCKARGTYSELPTGQCPSPYKSDAVLLAESLAREQALQQRLNAADQRIDELTKRKEPNKSADERAAFEQVHPIPDGVYYSADHDAYRSMNGRAYEREHAIDTTNIFAGWRLARNAQSVTEQFLEGHTGKMPDQLPDHTKMIAARNPAPDVSLIGITHTPPMEYDEP